MSYSSRGLLTALLLGALPAAAAPTPEAAFQFAVGRMALGEGSYRQALDAFAEAVRLAPEEGYIRLEYARLLSRLSRYSRAPEERQRRAATAFEQADAAARLAPDDRELLTELAQVYVTLAEVDGRALPRARDLFHTVAAQAPGDPRVLIALGQIHLQLGESAEAVEVLRRAVGVLPGNGTAEWLLARGLERRADELMEAGRSSEAEPLLIETLEHDPGALEATRKLAELQSRRGDYAGAVETRRGVPAPDLELQQRQAYDLYLLGAFDEGLGIVDEMLAEGADGAMLPALKALLLSAAGRAPEALDVLVAEQRKDPEASPSPAVTVVRELQRDGKERLAIELLSRFIDRLQADGETADVERLEVELAEAYSAAGDWPAVAALLAPRVPAGPPTAEDLLPLLLYAEALVHLDRGEEAVAVLPQAAAGPAEILLAKRAELLFRLDRPREAEGTLAALKAADDPDTVLQAALVYQRIERFAEAIPLLEEVVAAQPTRVGAFFQLGAAYERTGRRPQAIDTFRRLLELDPHYHPALNYLGYMLAEKGESLQEALSLVDRAVALDPDNGAYVDSLGWAHFQLGQYELARQFLERAARLVGEDPTVFEHLGDAYLAIGEPGRARAHYRRALELQPDNPELVRRKLEALE